MKAGMGNYEKNRARAKLTSEAGELAAVRRDFQGLWRRICDWFHQDCPLAELNKDRLAQLKGRQLLRKEGRNDEKVTCRHHLITGNAAKVAQSFLGSQAHKDHQAKIRDSR